MRIIVCGGRDWTDRDRTFAALDQAHAKKPITLIIAGGARGADSLGEDWADERGIPKLIMPANWAVHGRAAGPIRNRQMLAQKPDGVIAFPGGRGTADMVAIAEAAGVKVWRPFQP